jgi:hypothetical protein
MAFSFNWRDVSIIGKSHQIKVNKGFKGYIALGNIISMDTLKKCDVRIKIFCSVIKYYILQQFCLFF